MRWLVLLRFSLKLETLVGLESDVDARCMMMMMMAVVVVFACGSRKVSKLVFKLACDLGFGVKVGRG